MLVHHGLIGDATLGPAWPALGEASGLEWIVIERPGYGQTPPVAMGRVADWPFMIAPLLQALGVAGRFDVVGISAGAPYAYALAAGMPERVGRGAILSGVPFVGAPGVLNAYSKEAQAAYARYATADEAVLRAEFRAFCTNVARQIGRRDDMAGALAAILAHDVAGPAREARLQARDWGIDRRAITCPVDLWHSTADEMVRFGRRPRHTAWRPGRKGFHPQRRRKRHGPASYLGRARRGPVRRSVEDAARWEAPARNDQADLAGSRALACCGCAVGSRSHQRSRHPRPFNTKPMAIT